MIKWHPSVCDVCETESRTFLNSIIESNNIDQTFYVAILV
jgi:hypothetical protein